MSAVSLAVVERDDGREPETKTQALPERVREIRRRNGARSRGPVTEAGKRRSRMNALKHGLLAKVVPLRERPFVIDQRECSQLIEGVKEDIDPQTQTGMMLAESLGIDLLRLRFLRQMELELMEGNPLDRQELTRLQSRERRVPRQSIPEIEADQELLMRVLQSIQDNRPPDLTEDEVDTATALIWRRLTACENYIAEEEERIADLQRRIRGGPDDERVPNWREEIKRINEDLRPYREVDARTGRSAHGIRIRKSVASVLRGRRRIPKAMRPRWVQTMRELAEERTRMLTDLYEHDEYMSSVRNEKYRAILESMPKLETLAGYEKRVRQNITHTLQVLREIEGIRDGM